MNTLDILKAARAKLAQPGAWTTGCSARNADGEDVGVCTNDATCWCAYGAVVAVSRPRGDYESALEALGVELGVPPVFFGGCDEAIEEIANVNDSATRVEPVLELFDLAIAKLESAK